MISDRFATYQVAFAEDITESVEERLLSLREAIEYGLQNSSEIMAAKMNLKAVEEEVAISRNYLLPQIKIEERFLSTNNPAYVFSTKINQERFTMQDLAGAPGTFNNPDSISNFQTVLSLEMPPYIRKAWIGLDISNKNVEISNIEFKRKTDEIIFEIIKAYIGVRTATNAVRAAERGLENAEEYLRIAKARAEAGLGLQSDVLRAEVGVAEAKARLVSAKMNLLIAKRALGLIIGMDTPVNITDDLPIDLELFKENYYLEKALQGDEIKAMELRYETTKKLINLEKSDYLPRWE